MLIQIVTNNFFQTSSNEGGTPKTSYELKTNKCF